MLTFVFDDALLAFQYRRPAFDPLFQLPPTMASAHHKPRSA
jgi:hypothetical protein